MKRAALVLLLLCGAARADTSPRWYGWRLALFDAIDFGLILRLDGVAFAVCDLFGPAVIHGLSGGAAWQTGTSLLVRATAPVIGLERSRSPDGLYLGLFLSMAVDDLFLSWLPGEHVAVAPVADGGAVLTVAGRW
jgi:hypothetical protein